MIMHCVTALALLLGAGVIDTDVQNTFLLSWGNIVLAPGRVPIAPSTTGPGNVHGLRIVGRYACVSVIMSAVRACGSASHSTVPE